MFPSTISRNLNIQHFAPNLTTNQANRVMEKAFQSRSGTSTKFSCQTTAPSIIMALIVPSLLTLWVNTLAVMNNGFNVTGSGGCFGFSLDFHALNRNGPRGKMLLEHEESLQSMFTRAESIVQFLYFVSFFSFKRIWTTTVFILLLQLVGNEADWANKSSYLLYHIKTELY